MLRLRVSEVMKVAMERPGMWDDFLEAGKLDVTGEFLDISRERFSSINRKHFKGIKFGTVLHVVLAPAAAAA
jgi:hypothetical protein